MIISMSRRGAFFVISCVLNGNYDAIDGNYDGSHFRNLMFILCKIENLL